MALCIYSAYTIILITTQLAQTIQDAIPSKLPLKFINYTVTEESSIPLVLGNLVADFGLTSWIIKESMDAQKHTQTLTYDEPLSIDLIANAGKDTSMFRSSAASKTTPHLRLFPSTQWGSQYFGIRFRSNLIQELILNRPIDRDQVCQIVTLKDRNQTGSDQCWCVEDQCSTQDIAPQCEFRLTMTLYPLKPSGVEFYMIGIYLLDLNDNAPVFEVTTSEYVLSFKEDDPKGTIRQLPTASDQDLCHNGHLKYSLLWTHIEDSRLFSLSYSNNSRLELTLTGVLDRETDPQYRLYLLAHDSGTTDTRRTSTLPLRINVEDVNDCRPVFLRDDEPGPHPKCLPVTSPIGEPTQPVIVNVAENLPQGTILTRIRAVDGDAGQNAMVSYHLGKRIHPLTRRLFSINASTGELRTQQLLDREQSPLHRDYHRLIVIAKDGGRPSRSSSLTVLVRLLDINDNYPRIQFVDYGGNPMLHSSSMLRQLTEQSKRLWLSTTASDEWKDLQVDADFIGLQDSGKVIASFVVDDLDTRENGTVSCHLDRQLVRLQHLVEDRLVEQTMVQLKPLLSEYRRAFVERRSNRLHIPDGTSVRNDTQAKAYVLETSVKLLPSHISHLYLRIRCHDYGNPRLSSERTLHFRLWTEEHIRPKFKTIVILSDVIKPHCGEGIMEENHRTRQVKISHSQFVATTCMTITNLVESGTVLFQVFAEIPKLSNTAHFIQYQLMSENANDGASFFTIDSQKGTVSLRRALSSNPSRRITLNVEASLEGLPTDSTTGALFLRSRLQIEVRLPYAENSERQICLVRMQPEGKIDIIHLNEPYVRVNISEIASIGTRVTGSSAFGCVERGTNNLSAKCQLQLLEQFNNSKLQPSTEFKLTPTTLASTRYIAYELQTAAFLDREQKDMYALRLAEIGSMSHVSDLFILVHVLDVNDNPPILPAPFTQLTGNFIDFLNSKHVPQTNYSNGDLLLVANISVSVKELRNWVILRLKATDADVGENGKMSYLIEASYKRNHDGRWLEQKEELFFRLDPESGSLTISNAMNYEDIGSYLMLIVVRDHGQPKSLSTSGWVYLHVLDIPPLQQPINDLPQISQRFSPFGTESLSDKPVETSSRRDSILDKSGLLYDLWRQRHGKYIVGLGILLLTLLILCPTVLVWLVYCKRGKIVAACCQRSPTAETNKHRRSAGAGSRFEKVPELVNMVDLCDNNDQQTLLKRSRRSTLQSQPILFNQSPIVKLIADKPDSPFSIHNGGNDDTVVQPVIPHYLLGATDVTSSNWTTMVDGSNVRSLTQHFAGTSAGISSFSSSQEYSPNSSGIPI